MRIYVNSAMERAVICKKPTLTCWEDGLSSSAPSVSLGLVNELMFH